MSNPVPSGYPLSPRDLSAVFVSDVHLKAPGDANYQRMLAFLDGLDGLPQLFILGDFFDFWFGFNQVVQARYVPVLARLSALVEGGTQIHFVEGNHDFGMGDYFADTLKATVHSESTEITLGGKRLYLAHGDTIDVNDTGYQRLRRILRSGLVQGLARALPAPVTLKVANLLDKNAGGHMTMSSHLAELFRGHARSRFAEGYDGVVLGHCHAPEMLRESHGERPCFYANLGDWLEHFTYLAFVEGGEGDGFSLRRFV